MIKVTLFLVYTYIVDQTAVFIAPANELSVDTQGEYAEAELMYKRSLAIDTTVDGRETSMTATYMTQFAALLETMVRTTFSKQRECLCGDHCPTSTLSMFPWRSCFPGRHGLIAPYTYVVASVAVDPVVDTSLIPSIANTETRPNERTVNDSRCCQED